MISFQEQKVSSGTSILREIYQEVYFKTSPSNTCNSVNIDKTKD